MNPLDGVGLSEEMNNTGKKGTSKENGIPGAYKNVKNPYGDGKTSDKIIEKKKQKFLHGTVNLKKKFYDL